MSDNVLAFSATETGYNHTKIGKVCEDASDFYNDERMHICVVADGHGSDNYPRTDKGAKYAVDVAISCIKEFVKNADPKKVLDDERCDFVLLLQLAKSILNRWHQSVDDDYNRNPFEEKELEKVSEKYRRRYLSEKEENRCIEKAYGCTLIAYVVTSEYSFGLQIGDGKCVVVDRYGNFTEPIPWDENCQFNVTTSICDSDSIEEFRFSVSDQIPTAVFCGSDGIDDSYANPEELHALYRSILKIFVEHGVEVGRNEIREYLPVLTKKGSGDDVSIGVILDMDHAIEIAPLMEIQAQLFKRSTELSEKKHKLKTISERKESLLNKLQSLFGMGKSITDTASSIDKLTGESDQLKSEITFLESEIKELSRQEQELVYDSQVASFDEGDGSEEITSSEEQLSGDASDENNGPVDDALVVEAEDGVSGQPEATMEGNKVASKDDSQILSADITAPEKPDLVHSLVAHVGEFQKQCKETVTGDEAVSAEISVVSEETDANNDNTSALERAPAVVDVKDIVEPLDEASIKNTSESEVPTPENGGQEET